MKIYKYPKREEWTEIITRPRLDLTRLNETVSQVLADVRLRGDEAVKEYEQKFDKAELKSLAATQPLSGLSVTGNATFTKGGDAASAMFDISGNLLLPANMTLRIFLEPTENMEADLIRFSGALGGSGTAWSIDAHRRERWSVWPATGAIRIRYGLPGTKLILR